MPFKKEQRLMRRLKLIYLAIFVVTLCLLSLFQLRDYAVRSLNEQLQSLHYARQDFDAGVLHVLLADGSSPQWNRQIGRQRFDQTIASLISIANEHQTDANHLQEDVAAIKQKLEHFFTLDNALAKDLSQSIIELRLSMEQLHLALDAELRREIKRSRYWFYSLVVCALGLVTGLFITLARTEKKREKIHRDLFNTESRLSIIADSIDEVFWMYDTQRDKTLYVSSAFEKLWQLPVDGLYQKPDLWLDRVHPDDLANIKAVIDKPLKNNTILDYRIVLDNNEIRWISDRLFPVVSQNEDGSLANLVVAVATDVTQTRQLNEQLMVTQKLESLGKLTGGIAHDFNNLLTVIMGNAQLMQDMLANDPQFAEIAALIVKAAERGASLNRQLLAFASKQQLKPERIRVCELLVEMQQLLRRTLGDRIGIEYQPCSSDICCFVDAGQLQNAIINLCINAKDAMPQGGDIHISLQLSADNHYAMIQVADNGVGIEESVLPYIFEPFFTTKAKQKGSGLGLSMVYGFVKQSGGDIKVTSQPGEGSCFTLYLPVCADNSVVDKTDHLPERETTAGKKMLLVEDDALVRDSVLQMLNNTEYDIIVAENADTAMVLLDQYSEIEVLLTDIVMPGKLNGIALADYVRQKFPGTAIMLTSGFIGDLKEHNSFDSYAFLPKPFSKTQLLNALAQLDTR